jgi:hypothetical protein
MIETTSKSNSPTGSKRKSEGDSENDENLPELNFLLNDNQISSVSAKKLKSKDLIDRTHVPTSESLNRRNPSASIANSDSFQFEKPSDNMKPRSGSALPRYQSKIRSTGSTVTPRSKDQKVVKENDFSNNNSYLKPQSNFQVNVVPSISSNRIVNSGLIKRIKEVTVQSSAESLLKGYFEKAFTSSLEEMTGLLNIKTKTKWDIKDKLKKQEAAIKESKDLTITHFNELNDLKLNCINHDSRVNAILNDCIDSLQEKDLQIENLIIQESTFNSKLSSITDKLTETERLLEQSLKDQEPCNRENIKMKAELKELTRTMNDLEVSLSETKLQNSRLEEEMRTSTVSFDVKLSTQKDQYDKVYN